MFFEKNKLLIIAGPCAIETQEICEEVAQVLSDLNKELPEIKVVFKSSFDKANRMSLSSERGIGKEKGLQILTQIREKYGLPIITDVHEAHQCAPMGEACDMLQIPAFLCRQTDLLVAAAKTGRPINVKKGQFLAPEDMQYVTDKLAKSGAPEIWQTERGTTFGYQNLVVDMRSIPIMKQNKYPVILDATHCVQLPGAGGGKSSGKREYVPVLAKAALAAGADGLYIETHPNPEQAISDAASQVWLKRFSKAHP